MLIENFHCSVFLMTIVDISLIKQTLRLYRRPRPLEANSCISLIKQCNSLRILKSIHASMLTTQLINDIFFFTNLIARYISFGCLDNAYSLFSRCAFSSSSSDIFLWNVMLRGFVDNHHYNRSLQLYAQMLHQPFLHPDNFTFPFILKACGSLRDVKIGLKVHNHVVQLGYESDLVVSNSLISMYGKCGLGFLARIVFDKMSQRCLVSWSAMIGAYAQGGWYDKGILLFWRMLDDRLLPNRATMLNAMTCVHKENEADYVCRIAVDNRLDSDQSVKNAAMRMYARCGRIDVAREIFDAIIDKDFVSWSSMIEAYVQADLPLEALNLFNEMKLKLIPTDSITLLSVIRACSFIASFHQAKIVHGIVIRCYLSNKVALDTATVDLYVKCGKLLYATKVFNTMKEKNIISWSTIISGYGIHGYAKEALFFFNEMKTSIKPDSIVFVAVLSACSHAGLVSEGFEYFNSMIQDFSIKPRIEHYVCMVDLLGRAGKLEEACEFIEKMPIKPDDSVYGALLGACRIHLNVEIAEIASKSLLDLDMENSGRYVLLSNIYSLCGKREEADRIRALMKQRGVNKISGHAIC